MDDLDKAVDDTQELVVIGAMNIVVREVTMKNLRQFTAACAPFLKEFDTAGALAIRKEDGKELPPDEFALFKVISEHADAMVLAASLVSNAPVSVLEKLKPDQFFKVGVAVLRVNGDFFVRRLAPQLIEFARAMSLVGLTLSSGLSAPDTTQTH